LGKKTKIKNKNKKQNNLLKVSVEARINKSKDNKNQ
jgi:hypothetical protein